MSSKIRWTAAWEFLLESGVDGCPDSRGVQRRLFLLVITFRYCSHSGSMQPLESVLTDQSDQRRILCICLGSGCQQLVQYLDD
jgi:hypothetical protein